MCIIITNKANERLKLWKKLEIVKCKVYFRKKQIKVLKIINNQWIDLRVKQIKRKIFCELYDTSKEKQRKIWEI